MEKLDYEVALEKLHSLGTFGIKPGLERVRKLLELLGNPEAKLKCIHITGTNGKGSVSAMLESILIEAGYKIGKFTSPHLISYNERIIVQKQQITDDDFAELVQKVWQVKEQVELIDQPTQFEVLTAMAFLHFAEQQVDYAVIEVGMGGLLDSTNVITPVCSIITNVSLDHMDKCGASLSEIATHKAGIIKNNVPIVTAAREEGLQVISKTAEFQKAPLYIAGREFKCEQLEQNITEQTIKYTSLNNSFNFILRLLGKHQLENAAVAIKAFELISKNLSAEKFVVQGMDKTVWAGRAEIVDKEPLIMLDGAHNPAGARALRVLLDEEIFKEKQKCFILGFMQDKSIVEIVTALCKNGEKILIVKADNDLPRAASTEYLAQVIPLPTEAMPNYTEAIARAKKIVGTNGLICIAGSLYLVGNIKKTLLQYKQ